MEKVVPLSRRYEAHGKVFDSVTLREPRFEDLLALGEPFDAQRTRGGATVVVENIEVVAGYVRRCVVAPGVECLGDLGVKDARAVRGAVIDFFHRGETDGGGSPTP